MDVFLFCFSKTLGSLFWYLLLYSIWWYYDYNSTCLNQEFSAWKFLILVTRICTDFSTETLICQPQNSDSILLRTLAMCEMRNLEEEWYCTFKFLTVVSLGTTAKLSRAHKWS